MAHIEQKEYCLSIKDKFPDFFKNKFVLDIGALDINGNNQYLFESCGYLGVDLSAGKNIDIISKGHELNLPNECFDVIISTECFEHDPYYEKTIANIYRMLKPGGLFLFSCATTGRPEHGTRRTTPDDAPFIHEFGEWGDYYKNLEEHDIRLILDIEKSFSSHQFFVQNKTHDLYFWGIKNGTLQVRSDYSFLIPKISSDNSLNELRHNLLKSQTTCRNLESEILELKDKLTSSEVLLKHQASELENKNYELRNIQSSRSWRLTKPLRVIARLTRGELSATNINISMFSNLPAPILIRRLWNGLSYLARCDIKGFRNRLNFFRKEAAIQKWQSSDKTTNQSTWAVITPGHTFFVAQLIASRLSINGWGCDILTTAPKDFTHDFYIVLCPQIFDRLPPGEKRICFQMEQSVSTRWFTNDYLKTLENSLAVLDYSLVNIDYLTKHKIAYPHVHYLPIGAMKNYGSYVSIEEKTIDVLFYGDSLSSPRRQRMLLALQERFNVKVVNNIFGDEMIRLLKQSKVVLNIHYYENALLEMPRIQECLSLDLHVVSESSRDQNDYPELESAVIFFEQDSIPGMIAAIECALSRTTSPIIQSVQQSEKRFTYMFDRFLVAMGFLPASHAEHFNPPFSTQSDVFGLSLPETIHRRRAFETVKPADCQIFDGVRRSPGWVGCGLSYATLARNALKHGMKTITIMEDDVLLPKDYKEGLAIIKEYLNSKDGEWDVFSGVIASLHPDAHVIQVEEFSGRTFVTIDKMTSTVFNIYSETALKLFCAWNPENLDSSTNTIDRYLENQQSLRVIVMLPFFVGHREEMNSTLWGFQNTQYANMISDSEKRLALRVSQFSNFSFA